MPRYPCPHCDQSFIAKPMLDTHIHFVHNDGASQPPRPKPLVWTPPVTASTSGTTPDAEGLGHGEYMPRAPRDLVMRYATGGWADQVPNSLGTGVPSSGRFWVLEPLRPQQQQQPLNEATIPKHPPRPRSRRTPLRSATNAIDTSIVRQDMWPADPQASRVEEQRRRSASPERSGIPVSPRAYKFVVIFESQAAQIQQRLEVPTSTLWPSFVVLLQGASAPVAGTYIAGRRTGFTLDDGPWKYALVDHQGVREDRWRPLTSNLFYQAMISELMTHSAVWRHVLVCHVILGTPETREECVSN